MENNKINVSGSNGNNDIFITTSQNSENITVDTNRNSISINATNNNALHYSNKAKEWAEKSEESAKESKESADKSEAALNQILNNEDLKKVSANEENINKVANDIENVNFVGENIEGIVGLVESLENLGDTTNINIVASNVNGINTVANDIENVNTVANNKENIKTVVENTSNIQYVAENIEDIKTVEENKNIVLSQVAIAVEKANTSTEQAEISTNQANISIAQATISTTQATKSENNANLSYQYSQNAKDKADICIENASICEEQALISTTQANNSLNYSKNAKTSEENALIYSNNAKLNADVCVEKASIVNEKTDIAIEKSNNAKIWAEGTDSEVQALGGVHSSKGWAEIGGSGSDIDTSIFATKEELNNYVKNTDYATSSKHGVLKVDLATGISADSTGKAYISKATDSLVTAKTNNYRPLTPSNIDLAVKTGITTNTIELTEEEKASAKDWLGISGGSGFNLFDTKLSDHILEGNEAKGWALQGTYVYKEAVAGSRDGYPDFYSKVVEYYNNATETKTGYLSSNVTLVGNLADRQGVLSGFNVNSPNTYATLPNYFAPASNPWEFVTKITTGDLSANNMIIGCTTKFKSGVSLYVATSGSLAFSASANGSSWGISSAKTGSTLLANTEYWFKVEFTGSAYNVYYSTDGIAWVLDITVASTTAIYQGSYNWVLGSGVIGGDDWYRNTKEFDLNESYINIGGSRWWSGTNKYEYKQAQNGLKFYDVANKPTIDELFNNTGFAWFYGVDTDNERVFLPRNVWFDQLTGDTLQVGDLVYAGLPNITGRFGAGESGNSPYLGAFYRTANGDGSTEVGGSTDHRAAFDASRCSSIYGNSDTVQPNAIKKLLYICVGNTNVESAVTDVIDVTTTENDTIPLFTGQYFDFTPNNLSWLKAGEQANSGDIYTTAYNELVNCLNGVNKYNLKVIDIADMVSGVDYSEYWKVNQTEMYFITPTKLSYGALTGGVLGNGMTLGLTDGTNNYGTTYRVDSNANWRAITGDKNRYGSDIATNGATTTSYPQNGAILGVTTDVNKSGIIAEESITAQLYFKVANAVQNLELLDVGEITESLSNKVDINSKVIDGQWVASELELSTATAIGTYEIDLSSYLPNDLYNYEVLVSHYQKSSASTGSITQIWTDYLPNPISYILTSTSTVNSGNTFIAVIGGGRTISKDISSAAATENILKAHAYRRVGTNV